jgi:uncharacterized membrane protein
MFAVTRLSAATARRSAGRCTWGRSFSNTTPLGDQYDVVVVGKLQSSTFVLHPQYQVEMKMTDSS